MATTLEESYTYVQLLLNVWNKAQEEKTDSSHH